MAVNRQTTWADNTEVQVTSTAVRVKGVEVIKNPSMATGEIWVHLWNQDNPDLGADNPPDVTLYVPGPSADQKFSQKYPFNNLVFDTALAWFIAETAGDFGDAVTTNNIPVARIFYEPLA
jgi:hypothetical protein